MTSIQLTEELNILRKEKGLQTKFKHDNVLNMIKNCFKDIEIIKEKNKDGKETIYCELTEEQTRILTDNSLELLNMKKYFNYHKHTYYSNINTTDCVVSYSEYVQRSLELGHEWLSSTEHGGTFAWIETYNKSKDSGLKFIHGGEFYFVPYRNEETLKTVRFRGGTFCGYTDNTIYTEEKYMKDNSNYHLILIAKTRNAMKELNYIMSESYDTGYYYKPRVDIELLRGLPKGEVYCTSACFLKGTMVETVEGFKPIETINENDYVLTHNNKYEKVNFPTTRYFKGDIINLTFNRSNRNIECTDNHKFLTYDSKSSNAVWKESKDLSKKDILLTSIPVTNYTNNKIIKFDKIDCINNYCYNQKKCNHEIQLDEKDMMTFGLWLGDGHMSNKTRGMYSVGFSFNIKEFDNYYNSFVKHTMSKFGIEPDIRYRKDINKVELNYRSKELFNIFYQLFENKKSDGKFIPKKIKHISKEFDKALLFGYLLADGYFRYRKNYGGEIVSTTISEKLHCDIMNIYKTLNCLPTERIIESKIDKNGVNHKKTYYLNISSSKLGKINKLDDIFKQYDIFKNEIEICSTNKDIICINKNKYFKRSIKSISSYKYDGYVHCLNVGVSHSFNCEGLIVHNCIGGFLRDYPKTKNILEEFINIFGKDNFFLEVQPHMVKKQIDYNLMLKNIAKEYGLKLVAGVDSHMIKNDDSILRDYLLHSKGIIYEDEEGWTCDYPDYQTLKSRFMQQGIWTEDEVEEFIDNTLILKNTEDIKIDTSMKVPTIFPDKSREWRLSHLKKLIFDRWNEYKKHRVRKDNREKYVKEILAEYSVIEETCTEDYFLLNYYIIRRGLKLGGVLTKTGRGSGASYLINFMLGFTSIDRLKHKIPMLRERFMGKARILNGSMPDIDFNVWNREAFIQAQDELLGVHGNYFMTAYGTLGIKSAFKMLCRAKSIPTEIADEVTKLINAYEKDKKHDEDLKLEDYISNPKYLELIEESKIYTGIIDSFSVSPCSFVLFNGDLRREFGLIKDKHGNLMCCVTGVEAEKLGYLKNDLLIVKVVGMNDELYKRVNIKQPDSEDLEESIKDDKLVWELYANGLTQCLNQMESSGTTDKSTKFKPKTLEELCAFVSIIRPATASIYKSFEKREDFKYNIEELDETLRGEYLNGSWMIYQEQIMVLLQHLGFPDNETYTIMKAISKKKENVIKNIKPRFEESLAKIIIKDILNRK